MAASKIVIVSCARTPFGSFQGSLKTVSAPKLGASAIQAALKKANLSNQDVSQVIMGNVLSAGVGQAPARQAALFAGIDNQVPCLTINKVCGSGMQSLILAIQSLKLFETDIVVAGGMENMSQAPFLLKGARDGFRLGNQECIDSMVFDGLLNPYDQKHMGMCAELCTKEHTISREEQDNYAIESFKRALKAEQENLFKEEITPLTIPSRKQKIIVEEDEGPKKAQFEKIPKLRPVFDKEGSITAANASTINDGACAIVLMREETAKEKGLTPLATIESYAGFAKEPEWFTTAPIFAMQKAVKKASWQMDSVDLFEVNEAFSVVPLVAQKSLKIPSEKLNVLGGAISLGHPIGASGTRIVMSLITALKSKNQSKGVASICIGGGEALSLCLSV